MATFFITGIGTEVGKTISSAIVTEALKADYFKPVQAGDLHHTDTDKVKALISNEQTVFHKSAFALKTPMSPHAAAEIDNVYIDPAEIIIPQTSNHLVVEGAGGLLVPLNDQHTIFDLIQNHFKVLVVSRHYLGSINHTLLTLNLLKQYNFQPALIFSGDEHPSTESIILKMAGVPVIGRINEEKQFDKKIIKDYADLFLPELRKVFNLAV